MANISNSVVNSLINYSMSEEIEDSTGRSLPTKTGCGCIAILGTVAISHLRNSENFFAAAKAGSVWKIRLHLAAGINVNTQNSVGRTALYWATISGQPKVVEALLSYPDIDIYRTDINGLSPLNLGTLCAVLEMDARVLNMYRQARELIEKYQFNKIIQEACVLFPDCIVDIVCSYAKHPINPEIQWRNPLRASSPENLLEST